MDSRNGDNADNKGTGGCPGTASSLFELAMAGERAAEGFYDGIAVKFGHEAAVSSFWKTMASDEREHIRILENIRKTLTQAQLSAPADPFIFQTAAENARVQIKDVLGMVRNLNDACVLAHLWENSDVNRVFEFLVTQFIPFADDGRLIRLQVMNHRNRLVLFSQAFGEAEVRKKIPVT
jgi:hypothetical protein